MKKHEEKIFLNVWIRYSRKIEAAGVKKKYNPAIRFYEIRYALKSESTGVR